MRKYDFAAAIFIFALIPGCSSHHPETIHGIELGRPATEELKKAVQNGKIEYTEGSGAWMNLSNNIRGNITYDTFSDEESKDLLEGVHVAFFSPKIFTPPQTEEVGFYIFRVTENDKLFIRSLFFEKYGVINERDSVKDINDEKFNNVYSIYRGESWTVYSYAWFEDDREIMLSLRNEVGEDVAEATATYRFRRNYIASLKSEIKLKTDSKKNDF